MLSFPFFIYSMPYIVMVWPREKVYFDKNVIITCQCMEMAMSLKKASKGKGELKSELFSQSVSIRYTLTEMGMLKVSYEKAIKSHQRVSYQVLLVSYALGVTTILSNPTGELWQCYSPTWLASYDNCFSGQLPMKL